MRHSTRHSKAQQLLIHRAQLLKANPSRPRSFAGRRVGVVAQPRYPRAPPLGLGPCMRHRAAFGVFSGVIGAGPRTELRFNGTWSGQHNGVENSLRGSTFLPDYGETVANYAHRAAPQNLSTSIGSSLATLKRQHAGRDMIAPHAHRGERCCCRYHNRRMSYAGDDLFFARVLTSSSVHIFLARYVPVSGFSPSHSRKARSKSPRCREATAMTNLAGSA